MENNTTVVKVVGGGSNLTWQIGALKAVTQTVLINNVVFAEIRAGATSYLLTICNVDEYIRFGFPERRLQLGFILGKIIRKYLEVSLPEDAAEFCTDWLVVHYNRFYGTLTDAGELCISEFRFWVTITVVGGT